MVKYGEVGEYQEVKLKAKLKRIFTKEKRRPTKDCIINVLKRQPSGQYRIIGRFDNENNAVKMLEKELDLK